MNSRLSLSLAATAVGLLPVPAAQAQQARPGEIVLPEIEVTSPSPILSRPIPARPGTPAPSYDGDLPAGVLPVVTDSFAPVTVVPRSDILREQPRNLGDALQNKPGIAGTTYAPGAANRPIIRGLDNYRVRIQENGIGVHDVSPLGEDHAVPINPLVNDRIEVIRGPATLRYGSQGIGGVVSAENNRIPSFVPQGGYAARVLSGYSSVDNGKQSAATLDTGFTLGAGAIGLHADGFKTASDSYRIPGGTQFNSAAESQGGALGLSYLFDNGFIGLNYEHYDAKYHIPGGEAAASFTRLDPRQDKGQVRGEYRFQSGPFAAFRFWAGISSYRHDEIGIGEDGVDGIQATFKNREAEGRFELEHVPYETGFGLLTGAVGLKLDRTVLGTAGEAGGLLAPTDSRSTAGYVFEQLNAGNGWRIQGAGRLEHARATGVATFYPDGYLPTSSPTGEIDVNGDPVLAADPTTSQGRRRSFDPKSASFGVLRDLPFGFVGSINGQYVERAPAAPELYSRGSHDATETFEIGNPNLKLERARTVELGLRRAEGPVRIDATGYYTRYTGFIYKRLTGVRCGGEFESCGVEDELDQIVYSQQNATFHGAEIGSQIDVLPVGDGFAGVEAQYDFVRARFDDGTNVPRIPPHRVGGGVFLRANGWLLRLSNLHAFAHAETAPGETFTPGYNLLKAEVSYTTPLDRRRYGVNEVTVGLTGDNLLDDRVRNAASFKKDEILLPGRTVRLFLSARF